MTQKITDLLTFIYGEEQADSISERLNAMIAGFRAQHAPFAHPSAQRFSEQDAILITYADMVQRAAESPLQTLAHFVDSHLKGVISGVHLLPFYPYSSDDGFSVIDYHAVNPDLGDWHDVAQVGHNFRLMFDAVINHISAHSEWFQAFLRDEAPYTGYFTVVDPNTDLSTVFRPRALPLLSAFETPSGEKHVWTTFSADQQILSYHKALFALLRTSLDGTSHVLCLHNVSNASHHVAIDLNQLPIPATDSLTELISGQPYVRDRNMLEMEVGAYQVLWLKVER